MSRFGRTMEPSNRSAFNDVEVRPSTPGKSTFVGQVQRRTDPGSSPCAESSARGDPLDAIFGHAVVQRQAEGEAGASEEFGEEPGEGEDTAAQGEAEPEPTEAAEG